MGMKQSVAKPRALTQNPYAEALMEASDMNGSKQRDLRDLSLILVSPNVSEQMGGEAIKALQIYFELARQGAQVHQITHQRVRDELSRKFPEMKVSYVKDTWPQKLLFRIGLLSPAMSIMSGPLIAIIFQWRASRLAGKLLRNNPHSLVHFTSPVSPAMPYFRIPEAAVIIGPINGNIHHPPAFRYRETLSYRAQRQLRGLLQLLVRLPFAGKRDARALLLAGGERTRRSLLLAGCRDEQFVESLDSGVLDRLWQAPRISHTGRNVRFVHNGRLVAHKGTDLAIKSLKRTRSPIMLDIIGHGPELPKLRALTKELELESRVKFIEWIADHSKLGEALQSYRAFVFPSLAEANGIVVQEAMVMGLPVIALNWGGPASLVTTETGILINPISETYVIDELAKAMDCLADDGELAERMSVAGRRRANDAGFLWSSLIQQWAEVYRAVRLEASC
jgi:glycosyltransferase involved in cell wall biosynthesis